MSVSPADRMLEGESMLSCPVCGSRGLNPFPLKRPFELSKCGDCGLVFCARMPEAGDAEKLYEKGYYDYWQPALSMDAVLAMKRATARAYVQDIRRLRPSGKLLDVGCAYGYMLDAGRTAGFEVEGIELASEALEYLRHEGHRVHDRPLESAGLPDEEFDVVSMIDLIEHVRTPLEFMREAVRVMKRAGVVWIVTPDVCSLPARILGGFWPHYQAEHLCYYSRPSMRRLLEGVGLHVIRLESACKYLCPGYVLGHIRHFVGGWTGAVGAGLLSLMPRRMAAMKLRVRTELLAVARKP